MGDFCVRVQSKEFKDLYDSLDVDKNLLRTEVYKYASEHNGEWPTKEEVMAIMKPNDFIDASDVQIELRDKLYSTEKVLNTKEELDSYLAELNKYFPKEAISYYTNKEGHYVVNVAELENQKETKEILEKALRDSDGNLLAANGRYGFSVLKVIDSKGNVEYEKDNYRYTVFKEESLPQQNSVSVETFEGNWTREQVASQTDKVFLFGDNSNDRLNTHHVPTMTQAVIRGLPNAIGIDTKKDRGTNESSYFTDADFDVFKKQVDEAITQAKASGKTIVIPSGGIGTGKAMLQQKAPKLFEYLQQELNKLSEILNESSKAMQATQKDFQRAEEVKKGLDKTPSKYEGWTQEELMKEKQERQQNEESSEAVKKDPIKEIENQKFMEEQAELNTQFDNLLNSDLLSASDIADISEQAVFAISDLISDLQNNENGIAEIERLFGMSLGDIDLETATRLELVNAIGIKNLLEYAKNKFVEEAQKTGDFDIMDEAELIFNNWDAIILKANSIFSQIENFGLTTDKSLTINEVTSKLLEDFNNTEDPDALQEILGSLQEHWQVESRTQDVISSMTELVKRELFGLYLTDENGKIVTSKYGIKRRVKPRDAVNSILRWTQGATNINDMVEILKSKESSNTWIKPLIQKLDDKSGTYTTLQSQFFRTLYKPFQLYDVIVKEDGVWSTKTINKDPALNLAIKSIKALANIGMHPLLANGRINPVALQNLNNAYSIMANIDKNGLTNANMEEFAKAATEMYNILGYSIDVNTVLQFVNSTNVSTMTNNLSPIINILATNAEEAEYNPFEYEGGIIGYVKKLMNPLMDKMEDIAISSFYDSGKMYQSYVTPSFLTMMFDNFHTKDTNKFNEFIRNEYGKYEWFKRQSARGNTGWKHEWIRELVTDSKAREVFAHKVNLSYDKLNYMRGLNSMQYILSVLNEYFAENASEKESRVPAWFRIPMMSNKPSSEFIRFYSERGFNYKDVIVDKLKKVFDQELGRIQDVRTSNYDKKDQAFIKNFDTNGRKFQFLKWMNDYLEGGSKSSKALGKLIEKKLAGETLTDTEETNLNDWAKAAIKKGLEDHFSQVLDSYEKKGILKQLESIKNAKGFATSREAAENFLWNDFFASTQILEMTITDIAYYKDTEDLQKRLAQLHAPGIRGNKFATDFGGKRVSDGIERSIVLTDFEGFKSNIIENVSIVFDKKIEEAPKHLKAGYRAMKKNILDMFANNINIADAQAYNSPTSYRKKAFIFGTWDKKAEDVYQRLIKGDYNYSDLEVAFQPLKPFVYGHAEKSRGGLMGNLKVPIQNKNSEYLLIMADAILQGENTGRPNLLRALYTVMEESAKRNPTKGIDTIQFESAVKSGLQGKIDLRPFANDLENGEINAIAAINASIYNEDGSYNTNSVHELSFDCYAIQQEVPAHFLNHEQAHGSQERYIIPSDLISIDSNGNAVFYNIEGRRVTAQEFKEEYEKTISDNIEESINILRDELQLSGTRKEKNIALAKILQKEVNSSPRYGAELAQALLLDKNGEFRIPKGDPIQAKRIEQLVNSIVKNRVNKQEIAGGPVVQASNFGTSKELNIKFKNKNKPGEMLQTKSEFENGEFKNPEYEGMSLDDAYLKYLKDNQGGIAYMECYAPLYLKELFDKFANPDGSIDMEAIEATNPDLLKMVGYRI